MVDLWLPEMKVVAAYLLAVLGGNNNPTADDLKAILGSGISLLPLYSFRSHSSWHSVFFSCQSGTLMRTAAWFILLIALLLSLFFVLRDCLVLVRS